MSERNPTMVCLTCGMTYVEWLHADAEWMFDPNFAGPEPEPMIPNMHACPEPYPYHVAKAMVDYAAAVGGIVVHPRTKARIRLGLQQQPEENENE